MSTLFQSAVRYKRIKKRRRSLVPGLAKCPQKRGVVHKVFITTPRKPNSAKRKVARVLLSSRRKVSCYIQGIGHNLRVHSVVLVRGGRAQDLVGVRYKPIRGKEDFEVLRARVTRKSKYGVGTKR